MATFEVKLTLLDFSVSHSKVDGSAGRGRARKFWLECVNDDMKKFGLKKEMAHDRTVWWSAIHGNV